MHTASAEDLGCSTCQLLPEALSGAGVAWAALLTCAACLPSVAAVSAVTL